MNDKQKTILIVDDEEDFIEMMSIRLKGCGYNVETALNGVEGFEKAKQVQPDLILLDIMMPKMDGWSTCKELRSDPITKDAKIFIITSTRDLKQAKDFGADRVLLKPINYEEIVAALNS